MRECAWLGPELERAEAWSSRGADGVVVLVAVQIGADGSPMPASLAAMHRTWSSRSIVRMVERLTDCDCKDRCWMRPRGMHIRMHTRTHAPTHTHTHAHGRHNSHMQMHTHVHVHASTRAHRLADTGMHAERLVCDLEGP